MEENALIKSGVMNAIVKVEKLGKTANIHTVTIINVSIMPLVSMDPLTTLANVQQVLWVLSVKLGIFVKIRNAPGTVHVKMEVLVTRADVMLDM